MEIYLLSISNKDIQWNIKIIAPNYELKKTEKTNVKIALI